MENKSDVLLRIPKDTLVKGTRFPEIWNLLLGDESIFRETDKYYEIPADDDSLRKIAEAAIKECSAASSPGVRVADLLAARTRTLDRAVRSYKYNEESREVRQLPKIIEGDRTLGAAIFKMIAEVAGAQGKEAFFEPLSQRVLEADEWMMGRGEVEQAKSHLSEKANVSFLVISPESGVLTVCPADKIDAYETKVRDPLAKRGFLAAFAGGPWDKGFQSIFVGAVHDWYTSADGATADEKKTMESAWEAYKKWVGGVGRKSIGEMLVDGANDEKAAAVLSIFFHAQGQNHTKCPIQTSTGVQGALHLGMLPEGVLRGVFQRGRDGGISGGKESMRGGVFPSEQEGEEIARRYGSTWTPAIRAARLGLIHQSMEEVKSGSVRFLELILLAKDPKTKGNKYYGLPSGILDDEVRKGVDTLVEKVRGHFGDDAKDAPVGLSDLCYKFISEKIDEKDKKALSLKDDFEKEFNKYINNKRPSRAERYNFCQLVAKYMLNRFGEAGGGDGDKSKKILRGLGLLVSAAARSQILYLVAEPSAPTTKVGIAVDFPKRHKELSKEDGPLLPEACITLSSIPVADWHTSLITDIVFNKTLGGERTVNGKYTAKSLVLSDDEQAVGMGRWKKLEKVFGFNPGSSAEEVPSLSGFFRKGIQRLIDEADSETRELCQLPVPTEDEDRGRIRGRVEELISARFGESFWGGGENARRAVEAMTELWISSGDGDVYGDPVKQEVCVKALNVTIASLFYSERNKGGEGERMTGGERLFALLERVAGFRGDDIDGHIYEDLDKYAVEFGAQTAETSIHEFLGPVRVRDTEMMHSWNNHLRFFELVCDTIGGEGKTRRFTLAENSKKGAKARETLLKIRQVNTPLVCCLDPGLPEGMTLGEALVLVEEASIGKGEDGPIKSKTPTLDTKTRCFGEISPPQTRLKVAELLASENGKGTVDEVYGKVESLLGLAPGELASAARKPPTKYNFHPEVVRELLAKAAEARPESGELIPSPDLVSYLRNKDQYKKEARKGVIALFDKSEANRRDNSSALAIALGSGTGLGGYPAWGDEEARKNWIQRAEEAGGGAGGKGILLQGPNGNVWVSMDQIKQAASGLDEKWKQANTCPETKMIFAKYAASACGEPLPQNDNVGMQDIANRVSSARGVVEKDSGAEVGLAAREGKWGEHSSAREKGKLVR